MSFLFFRSLRNAACLLVLHCTSAQRLLGLVFAFPSWVNPVGKTPYAPASAVTNAANYVTAWVGGVKKSHNLTVDWVGLWNEQTYTDDYVGALRSTLDAHGHKDVNIVGSDSNWEPMASDYLNNTATRSAISALTQHYPHCDATPGVPGKGRGTRSTLCALFVQTCSIRTDLLFRFLFLPSSSFSPLWCQGKSSVRRYTLAVHS